MKVGMRISGNGPVRKKRLTVINSHLLPMGSRQARLPVTSQRNKAAGLVTPSDTLAMTIKSGNHFHFIISPDN